MLAILVMWGCGGGPTGPYESVDLADAGTTLADTLCTLQLETCACDPLPVDPDTCEDDLAESFQAAVDGAIADGLTYNPVCMAELANLFGETIGCATADELAGEPALTGAGCKVVSGADPLDAACTIVPAGAGDSCEQGLLCVAGTCRAIGTIRLEGDSCTVQDACEAGTYCDAFDTGADEGTCTSWPALGEACPRGQCALDARCEPTTQTCVEPGDLGDACQRDDSCTEGVCDFATDPLMPVCAPAPPAEEGSDTPLVCL
jgi:hypothetical protein